MCTAFNTCIRSTEQKVLQPEKSMERQEHTTQQSTPQHSRWSRIRVFNRPQSRESQSPSVVTTVLVLLAVVALVAVGIILF